MFSWGKHTLLFWWFILSECILTNNQHKFKVQKPFYLGIWESKGFYLDETLITIPLTTIVQHNKKNDDHFKSGWHSSNGNPGVKGPISHFQFFEPSTELIYFSLLNVLRDRRCPRTYRILKFYFKEPKEICSVSRFCSLA